MADSLVFSDPSPLDDAFIPETLTARQEQIEQLLASLKSFTTGGPPLHALLFGRPGTGKTAVVRHVVQRVAEETSAKVAYVNCWESPSLYAVADSLVTQLRVMFAERGETFHKMQRIKKVIGKHRLVLVLDEIDRVVPKERDNILYQCLQMGNVAIIGVAGSRQFLMDLDHRVLSRFTPVQLECPSYLADDIFRILTDRAGAALRQETYELSLLRAISVNSDGDARLAIGTLRRAAQLADAGRMPRIAATEIARATGEMKTLRRKYLLDRLTLHHRYIVGTIEREPGISTQALWETYQVECEREQKTPVALRTFTSYVARLIQLRLIRSEPKPGDGNARVFYVA